MLRCHRSGYQCHWRGPGDHYRSACVGGHARIGESQHQRISVIQCIGFGQRVSQRVSVIKCVRIGQWFGPSIGQCICQRLGQCVG